MHKDSTFLHFLSSQVLGCGKNYWKESQQVPAVMLLKVVGLIVEAHDLYVLVKQRVLCVDYVPIQ
jgi:hypothetical protein